MAKGREKDGRFARGNNLSVGNSGGVAPMYKTVEEMQSKIDAYIAGHTGRQLEDKDGNPMTYKGQPIIVDAYPLTVTGLAVALGFRSRQALLNYQYKDPDFDDSISRAKTYIEAYVESRLFDKDGCNGAKFSLSNNFRGWQEKQEIEVSSKVITVDLLED
jgi:hypothetical protein